MFIDSSKALHWAFMMRSKAIIDPPSINSMGGGNKSTRNELLIGLSPQETMQQSADIIKIVDDMAYHHTLAQQCIVYLYILS